MPYSATQQSSKIGQRQKREYGQRVSQAGVSEIEDCIGFLFVCLGLQSLNHFRRLWAPGVPLVGDTCPWSNLRRESEFR